VFASSGLSAEEEPSLNGDVRGGCASGQDYAEFGADYVEGVDGGVGRERELADDLRESRAGELAHVAAYGHVDGGVRPLDDFEVDLIVVGYVEDTGHEDLAEGVGGEGFEVGCELGGRHLKVSPAVE
jgi:hypothetical protein